MGRMSRNGRPSVTIATPGERGGTFGGARRHHRPMQPARATSHDRRMDVNLVPEPDGWVDQLTGLEGPAFWQRVLVAEVARAAKYRTPLTVVVLELDGLQRIWDEDGEDAGFSVLHGAAESLRRSTRAGDYCTRIGPCRFGIVLAATDRIAAINYVERLREHLLAGMPPEGRAITLRFGWASPLPREAPDSLVRRAQRRLVTELMSGA